MAKASKRRGPQNTLRDLPHMAKIRMKLAEKGCSSLKDAVALLPPEDYIHYQTLLNVCRDGRSPDSGARTERALRFLGIFEIVPLKRTG